MRVMRMFVGSATVLGLVGCGGSSKNSPPAGDAGVDSSVITDSGSSSNACTTDANLATANPPDAALNDAGASVGACLGCAKSSCTTDVTACEGDCECTNIFSCLYECLGSVGGTLTVCLAECSPDGGLSINNLSPAESGLLLCAYQSCTDQCGVAGLLGGGGGGKKDSGAGANDSGGADSSTAADSSASEDAADQDAGTIDSGPGDAASD